MPRRGRHRTTLPVRLIAAIAALLVTGGIAVAAGSAAAKSDSGSGSGILRSLSGSSKSSKDSKSDKSSGRSKDSGKQSDSGSGKGSGKGSDNGSDSGSGGKDSGGKDSGGKSSDGKDSGGSKRSDAQQAADNGGNTDNSSGEGETSKDKNEQKKKDNEKKVEFPGREKIRPASADDYVDITSVGANGNRGDGGVFGGGSYTVNCGVSDHNNSDNYMAAPGKRNGAQHVHDYVGNTTINADTESGTLDGDGTSCTNGDRSTYFWPVLRDLNGRGPDVGQDGGSKDGNVGAILKPISADLTYHGHPGQKSQPIPHGLMMIMGNAKAKAQDGKNANSKYTCTGFGDRVTDKYPICPAGSHLQRLLDYPSCWDGKNLESKDFRQHIKYPDSTGRCDDDSVPVPQLRITLTYDQPAGRAFSIDSFPDNQHDPSTDHSDYENASRGNNAKAGADCINADQRCRQ